MILFLDPLAEDELLWLKQISVDYNYDYDALIKISPGYVRQTKDEFERNQNKGNVRKELEALRRKVKYFNPQELIGLRNKKVRESQGIENFAGIYIIQNWDEKLYYIGQSERVFDRAYQHFVTDPSRKKSRAEMTVRYDLPEIYNDYRLGNVFTISLIPLKKTSFSTLNELEDNAIRAYNALIPYGYNRNPGNINDKPTFGNGDYEKAANLLLDKIKETETFLNISNSPKRKVYTVCLFSELGLPFNTRFYINFLDVIKAYKKAIKKGFYKKYS